jgi:hypothetical protein
MAARDVTNGQLEKMTQDDRSAWLDSMDDDEELVARCPSGTWHELVMTAYFKHALLDVPMPAGERLRFLEFLDDIPRRSISMLTREVVAAIKPANNALVKIIHEARALDRDEDRGQASFKLLSSWECRWHALKVQPSLLEALRLSPAARGNLGASQPDAITIGIISIG